MSEAERTIAVRRQRGTEAGKVRCGEDQLIVLAGTVFSIKYVCGVAIPRPSASAIPGNSCVPSIQR